ncbi:ABC transporter permease [candidate division KSB1 bacterium]
MFIVSRPEERFSVIGDMEEEYNEIISEDGNLKAFSWYWRQILIASPPFIFHSMRRSTAMFKNYLKTAIRNIKRNRITSVINITGLAIGIAFSLLVYLFVHNEYTFDEFHENSDSIYQVWCEWDGRNSGHMSIRIYDDFKRLYSEIDEIVRFTWGRGIIRNNDIAFREEVHYIDPVFTRVFSFPLIAGDSVYPLRDKNNVIISKEMADKYFTGEDPVGKTLEIELNDVKDSYFVTAVIDNMKNKSSIKFDFLFSFEKYIDDMRGFMDGMLLTNYNSHNPATFFLLNENADVNTLREKLLNIDDQIDQGVKKGTKKYRLLSIRDIHLNTDIMCRYISKSDPVYSFILAGLSAVVLLIACINFMTLSIGLSVRRFREVGVRKVMGAQRLQLFRQYIGESLLSASLAMLIGIAAANLALPVFIGISGRSLEFSVDIGMGLMIISLILVLGMVSGGYPALIQSGFDPVRVFKGIAGTSGKNRFTKGLIVVQFTLSIALIVSTIVFRMQLDFISERKLGFDQERLIELALNAPENQADLIFERFKNEIAGGSGIVNVDAVSTNYGWRGGAGFWTRLNFRDRNDAEKFVHFNRIGYDYLETMNIPMVMGRNFSPDYGSDPKDAVIINEAAVKHLGLIDPIGKNISGFGTETQQIIGVFKDFHFGSLHTEIDPLVLSLSCSPVDMQKMESWSGRWPQEYRYAVIRIAEGDPRPVMDYLKESLKKVSPNAPFDVKFIDDTIQSYYESDRKWGTIVNYSSLFAVVIACMGLFGLSLVTSQQRIREIGIRKVLGASVGRIISLVSAEMLLLVIISSVFAWPAAYYVMNRWLQNFSYRIELSFVLFIVSGLLALFIAAVTISFQTIKAALKNPVDSLRYE